MDEGVLLMMAVDNYPYITFRALGAFHLLVGLLFIIEGAIATGFLAAFAMIDFNPLKLPHPLDWSLTWAHNISPIAFGILCATAGIMALSMTRYRRTYLPSLKVGFLVLTTLLAVIAAPVMVFFFVRRTYLAAMTTGPGFDQLNALKVWVVGAVFAVLAFIEFILAIISAAVCCCHSPIPDVGEELEVPPQKKKTKPKKEMVQEFPSPESEGYDAGSTTKVYVQKP